MLNNKTRAARLALLALAIVFNTALRAEENGGAACDIANQEDSYVFALSWQPAFCESHADKPECRVKDAKAYQATHFTLHGLWPNKAACGTQYGYCGAVKNQPGNFCEYPGLSLSPSVRDKLAVVMPSVSAGSCLERHEWHKHGTCQEGSADQYYEQAVTLVQQFNDSGIASFMGGNLGKHVSLKAFLAVLDKSLGENAHKRAKLGCKNGLLVDIYLSLPADIKPGAGLKDLLAKAPDVLIDKSCSKGFLVDAIGQH